MTVSLTGFAFDGNTENEGVDVNLGIYHVQGARISKKTVRKFCRDGEEGIKYDGEIVCNKGDAYMVGFTVTEADDGTLNAPKFSLKSPSEEQIFPEIAVLVAPGGDLEGYLPIFLGDNSGPHICAIFHNCVKEYCVSMGWKF